MIHELKCWPQYFERVWQKDKTFEVRYNDRDFQTGDTLILREYDPITGQFTGRCIKCKVQYLLNGGDLGIENGYVVMAISDITLTS